MSTTFQECPECKRVVDTAIPHNWVPHKNTFYHRTCFNIAVRENRNPLLDICAICKKEINTGVERVKTENNVMHKECCNQKIDVKAMLIFDESKNYEELLQGYLRDKYKHGHPDFLTITLEELELHDKKNHDYASGGDPMGNFKRVESILSLYPNLPHNRIVVALTYMLKQLDAILWGLCQNIQHKVEGLDGRFADVHVYTKLARLMWRDLENEKALDKAGKTDIGTGEI